MKKYLILTLLFLNLCFAWDSGYTYKINCLAKNDGTLVKTTDTIEGSHSYKLVEKTVDWNKESDFTCITKDSIETIDSTKTKKQTDITTLNSTWSGKSLGSEITTAQLAAIKDGSFEGIGLGDYWTLDGKTWRVAHFNYVEGGENNLTIVPDGSLGDYKMNTSNTNATGYYGSAGYSTLHSTVKAALPEVLKSHLYTHDVVVSTATTSDFTNTWETKSSDGIELMSVVNVFGSEDNITSANNSSFWKNYGYASASSDKQFAMFKFATDGTSLEVSDYKTTKADNIVKSNWYWLSSSVLSSSFAFVFYASNVSSRGYSLSYDNARRYGALRPALTIIGE